MGERYPVLLSCTMAHGHVVHNCGNLRIYILCGSLYLLLLEYTLQTAVACTRPVRGSVKRICGRVEARAPGDWPCPVALGMLQTRPTSKAASSLCRAAWLSRTARTQAHYSAAHTHTHTRTPWHPAKHNPRPTRQRAERLERRCAPHPSPNHAPWP